MNVIITGASKGIGKELLKKYLNSGDKVWAMSRSSSDLGNDPFFHEFEKSEKLKLINVDFTNLEEVESNCKNLKETLQEIDILINNAGLLVNKPCENISISEMQNVYRVNVLAPYILIQQFYSLMGIKERGHIINIGSMGGIQGSVKFQGLSIYSSSKMAIAGITECLAEEFKDKNLSINCLAIGSVQTEMLAEAFPGYIAQQTPESMADFIFNFSQQAKDFINGKIIPVSISTP